MGPLSLAALLQRSNGSDPATVADGQSRPTRPADAHNGRHLTKPVDPDVLEELIASTS
jgi:hypothetical protein